MKAYTRLPAQTKYMIGTVVNGLAFVYLMANHAYGTGLLCLIVGGMAFYKFLKQGP